MCDFREFATVSGKVENTVLSVKKAVVDLSLHGKSTVKN
jgi:hypothetical protein